MEEAKTAAAPAVADSVSWTAAEFIAHKKTVSWYLALIAGAAIAAGLIYLVTRDIISAAVIIVAALAFAVIAGRQPRELQYKIDATGISVGQKRFDYSAFKSFTIVPEGVAMSLIFRPLKRFAPLTTIYYQPKDEKQIIALLRDRLPFEEPKTDVVDNIMRRIHF